MNEDITADEMFLELGYKCFYKSVEYDGMCDYITMQESKAINKKCREMGWIE